MITNCSVLMKVENRFVYCGWCLVNTFHVTLNESENCKLNDHSSDE